MTRIEWKAVDFEDGTFGIERRRRGELVWILATESGRTMRIKDREQRDKILRELNSYRH